MNTSVREDILAAISLHRWVFRALSLPLFALSLCLVSPTEADAVIRVVTTTPDLAALVADVGGKEVSVESMSSRDQDPHYVDPRPSLVLKLARADMLLVNGLDLEIGWLPPLQVNARNAAIQVGSAGYFDASEHVQLMGP